MRKLTSFHLIPLSFNRQAFFSALVFFLISNCCNSYSQINFNKELSAADPIKKTDTISENEKIIIHLSYLIKAVATQNIQQQFYAHLFLWSDFFAKNDYEAAAHQIFSADSIAQESGNLSWQAEVLKKKGILAFQMNDAETALKDFRLTLQFCSKTKDSFCISENLQKVGLAFHKLQQFDSANFYFSWAAPLIKKHTDSTKLYAYYSNYSNLLKDMGDYSGAKLYLDSSLAIVMKGNDLFKQSLSKNNLAAFYVHLGEYDAAFKILEECISINKQHGWFEQLSFNYANMSSAFSKQGNYRPAFEYLEKYYSIDDSLKGAKVKLNIANLIASNAIKEKEIALTKSKLALAKSQDALIFRTIFLVMILTLVVIGILFWSWQSQKNKKERVQNIERLSELTQILLKKNSLLSEMEKELEKNSDLKIQIAETQNFDTNLYNQRILTVEDWSAFKTHFESAYPGYLIRLRNTYSTLTEAEERLFIFIKLNLKSKEIASMLGISIDTVKKTRYRLRKRIELTEEEDLDAFVLRF